MKNNYTGNTSEQLLTPTTAASHNRTSQNTLSAKQDYSVLKPANQHIAELESGYNENDTFNRAEENGNIDEDDSLDREEQEAAIKPTHENNYLKKQATLGQSEAAKRRKEQIKAIMDDKLMDNLKV